MNFDKDYKEFLEHITVKCGTSGPLELSTEEKAAVRLFAAYLNCRYGRGAATKLQRPTGRPALASFPASNK